MSQEPERPLRITPDMLLGRRVDLERRLRPAAPLTLALIGLLALIFIAEVAAGALASPAAIVAAGALEVSAVAAGQYWRLLSATFLHGGVDHLVGNLIALYILGLLCEHAFGRQQFLVLYVLSGLAGSLLSVLASPGPAVGASGAIFGLQGAAIVLVRRHRERLLLRDRRIAVVLAVWAAYTIAVGFLTPYVDNAAHIGGGLAGALLAYRLHPVILSPMSAEHAVHVRRWLRVVVALLVYTALAWLLATGGRPR
ncbi:MAG: rhomboid family intramembrane serine protease [Candidatus Rokuibacteriota bacterium]